MDKIDYNVPPPHSSLAAEAKLSGSVAMGIFQTLSVTLESAMRAHIAGDEEEENELLGGYNNYLNDLRALITPKDISVDPSRRFQFKLIVDGKVDYTYLKYGVDLSDSERAAVMRLPAIIK